MFVSYNNVFLKHMIRCRKMTMHINLITSLKLLIVKILNRNKYLNLLNMSAKLD